MPHGIGVRRSATTQVSHDAGIRIVYAYRDVIRSMQAMGIAQRSLERAAERKLQIERTKLNAGRSSNFRLVRFEDDLVRSQDYEIGVIAAYLNALTALDHTQATGATTASAGG